MRPRMVARSAGVAARMGGGMAPASKPPDGLARAFRAGPKGLLLDKTGANPAYLVATQLPPMTRRPLFPWSVCAGVALFFARLTASAEVPNEHVVLQLPYSHQFQFAGVYAAMSQGYFKEHHLDVELRIGTRDRRPVAELESGRAQYAIGQSGALLDRLNGSPIVALAAIFQHSPFVLMMRADSGIATPADLIGRRLALSPTNRYTEMRAMLLVEGLKPEQLTIVPDQWNKNELLSNEAEVISSYITDGPFEAGLHGMEVKMLRPYDYGVDFYGDFLLTSETELRQHPERARAMREAILRGWEYALAHREEVIEWIFTHLPDEERSRDRTRDWFRY